MNRLFLLVMVSLLFVNLGCSDSDDNAEDDTAVVEPREHDTSDADNDSDSNGGTDLNTDTNTDGDTDDDSEDDSETEYVGPTLTMKLVGDVATELTWSDSSVGQTPTVFDLGIEKLELMTSATDENPVNVFDCAPDDYELINMLESTDLVTIPLSTLPDAVYTHARVKLAIANIKVAATGHAEVPLAGRQSAAGTATVTAALSDTIIDGTARAQDWSNSLFEFEIPVLGPVAQNVEGTIPEITTNDGSTIVKEGGELWVIMEFASNMEIKPSLTMDYVATVTMFLKDSFRWEDTTVYPDYATGVFDAEENGTSEPVTGVGPGKYTIVVE